MRLNQCYHLPNPPNPVMKKSDHVLELTQNSSQPVQCYPFLLCCVIFSFFVFAKE